jgi:hypothetical protein
MGRVLIIAAFLLSMSIPAISAQKKFCHTYTTHNKNTLVCKTVKLHKQVKGTPIPRKSVK